MLRCITEASSEKNLVNWKGLTDGGTDGFLGKGIRMHPLIYPFHTHEAFMVNSRGVVRRQLMCVCALVWL